MQQSPKNEGLQKPIAWLVDQEITDPFLRRMCDFGVFALSAFSGMDAGGTPLAEMHFMINERFRGSVDHALAGSQAIVDALVRGLEKHGGALLLGAHVESVLVEDGRVAGVQLRRGVRVRARNAVVSNATVWDTRKLVPDGAIPEEYRRDAAAARQTGSIVHLHRGTYDAGYRADRGRVFRARPRRVRVCSVAAIPTCRAAAFPRLR